MLLPQGRQLLSFLKKLSQFFRSFQRWHLFFLDLVIFAWNLWGGKEKKLGWATVWRMVHDMTAKRMRSNWAPWRREFLQLYIYFPIFATTIQIYVSTKDYENMCTLGCHYTSAIKLTTRLLRHSLWPCNLHSTWERKNTLHSYNTSKHICSCSRNSVDNTKLLCNY